MNLNNYCVISADSGNFELNERHYILNCNDDRLKKIEFLITQFKRYKNEEYLNVLNIIREDRKQKLKYIKQKYLK